MTGTEAQEPISEEPFSRERLIAAHEAAALFFQKRLLAASGEPQRRYLAHRGLQQVIGSERWTVGYAPATWTATTDHLRDHGFTDTELLGAGLSLRCRRGTLIDRFRDRITIGIHNTDRELVAFVGRAAPNAVASTPKYINSPCTAIYSKRAVLFGLGEQRDRLATGATPVIVEGPLDVFAVEVTATDEFAAVAPCGTGLTEEHAIELAAHSRATVLVCYDSDAAGGRAATKAYPALSAAFQTVQASQLPSGTDPATTLTLEGGQAMLTAALRQSRPLADLVIDERLKPWQGQLDNAEARVSALRSAAAVVTQLAPSEIARQAGRLGHILDLPHETVTRELTAALLKPSETPRSHVFLSPSTPVTVRQSRRAPAVDALRN